MAQKLFWISEKGPLSGPQEANLLRSGSVPPLQRLCQEAVLRASWEKCVACIPSGPIVYGQSAKRDVINPLFTFGFEGRNRDVRGA